MGMGKFREIGTNLQNASNKKIKVELFHYLHRRRSAIGQTIFCEGNVISTVDENVLGSPVPDGDESAYHFNS